MSGASYSVFDALPEIKGFMGSKSGEVFRQKIQASIVQCQSVSYQSTCPTCKQGCCGSDLRSCVFQMRNEDFVSGESSVIIPDLAYVPPRPITSCGEAKKLFNGNTVLQTWSGVALQKLADASGCGLGKDGQKKLKSGLYRVKVSELNCQNDHIVSWPRMTGELLCDTKKTTDNENLKLHAKVDLKVAHVCRDCKSEKTTPADSKH